MGPTLDESAGGGGHAEGSAWLLPPRFPPSSLFLTLLGLALGLPPLVSFTCARLAAASGKEVGGGGGEVDSSSRSSVLLSPAASDGRRASTTNIYGSALFDGRSSKSL